MMRNLCSDWLPELILPARDFSRWFRKNSSLFGRLINPLLTKLVWSRWLGIGLVLFAVLLTSTLSIKTPKTIWPISSYLNLSLGQ